VIDISNVASGAKWLNAISRRVHEREIRRQILHNRIRKTSLRSHYLGRYVAGRIPVLLPEFLKMMIGALLAFWIIGKLLEYIFHARLLYTFAVFGFIYSVQATYYKYRLSVDPGFKIPKCRCVGYREGDTERVLKSTQSAILRVPNSVLGAVFYSALLVLAYLKHVEAVRLVAIVAVVVSAYLSYVMVVKIGSLCVNCINVSALNVLILLQVLR
jgi:uncharacterized membrane protein